MSAITTGAAREGDGVSIPHPDAVDEKSAVTVLTGKEDHKITGDELSGEEDRESEDAIIITGADAAAHLLPLRDDFDSALTFRSIILASGLACFQAVMYQIYMVAQDTLAVVQMC